MAALHATDHDADALAQIQQIPPEVRKALATDVEYQQTLAAIYAANGDQRGALALLMEVQDYYRGEGKRAPASVDIATAWTLFNLGDDRELYRQLMGMGDRRDMKDEERRQVQTIWASWAQRRAAQAAAAGNPRRAVDILMAAAQAFPGNPAVSKALAAGFVQAGQPKDAMAIYQALDMTNATPSDYQSMVGAAIAVQNMKQAEAWLRDALGKFPNDAKVLTSAAQFEQARGDRARAAEYWRASLNAMPSATPTATLAHELDKSDLVKQTRPAKPTDLVNLLNPDQDAYRRGRGRSAAAELQQSESDAGRQQAVGARSLLHGDGARADLPDRTGKWGRGGRIAECAIAFAGCGKYRAGHCPDYAAERESSAGARWREPAGQRESEHCAAGDQAGDAASQACATANEALHTAGVAAESRCGDAGERREHSGGATTANWTGDESGADPAAERHRRGSGPGCGEEADRSLDGLNAVPTAFRRDSAEYA